MPGELTSGQRACPRARVSTTGVRSSVGRAPHGTKTAASRQRSSHGRHLSKTRFGWAAGAQRLKASSRSDTTGLWKQHGTGPRLVGCCRGGLAEGLGRLTQRDVTQLGSQRHAAHISQSGEAPMGERLGPGCRPCRSRPALQERWRTSQAVRPPSEQGADARGRSRSLARGEWRVRCSRRYCAVVQGVSTPTDVTALAADCPAERQTEGWFVGDGSATEFVGAADWPIAVGLAAGPLTDEIMPGRTAAGVESGPSVQGTGWASKPP